MRHAGRKRRRGDIGETGGHIAPQKGPKSSLNKASTRPSEKEGSGGNSHAPAGVRAKAVRDPGGKLYFERLGARPRELVDEGADLTAVPR